MRTAVDYGRLDANPLEKIRLKRRKLNRAKPFLRVDQFFLLVEALAEPYASMVYVAGFTGLRVSELAGLEWRNVGDGAISTDQRYARGDWDEPKSHAGRATISVDQHVLDRIHRLKTIEVVIKAGRAERRYPAVKSSSPSPTSAVACSLQLFLPLLKPVLYPERNAGLLFASLRFPSALPAL